MMHEHLEGYLNCLRSQLKNEKIDLAEVKVLGENFLRKELEITEVLYALLCKKAGFESPDFNMSFFESGAVPLLKQGHFPWKGLPYPSAHAELGNIYLGLEKNEIAEKIARWQHTFAISHDKTPLYALFSQEGTRLDYDGLRKHNKALFDHFSHHSLISHAVDEELGLVMFRTKDSTAFCAASGCKSGLGAFLYKDAGIVNFGVQSPPLGAYEEFGIAGRPLFFEHSLTEESFEMHFQTRIAAKHSRHFLGINDSGFSGLWQKGSASFHSNQLVYSSELEGNEEWQKKVFVFFGKGSACVVAGTHKLQPRSLDRYLGPSQKVSFLGKEGNVVLEALEGVHKMEIIPLAGGDSFWTADFLVAFFPSSSHQKYLLRVI